MRVTLAVMLSLAVVSVVPARAEMLTRPGVAVDLADPVLAAAGDASRLDYFGAVQERIQQAAGRRGWLSGDRQGGVVYVSFVLTASGGISRPAVVRERSTASLELQELAVRIIKAAAPFPPFPPSIEVSRKVMFVPLEFMVDGNTGVL